MKSTSSSETSDSQIDPFFAQEGKDEGTITAYDLQVSILEAGYIIPVDVVLNHFAKADVDDSGDLTEEELTLYLKAVATSRCEILELLLGDSHFLKGVGYTIAGLLLVAGSFLGALLSKYEAKYIDLAASLLYASISFYFVITYPLKVFKMERAVEKKMFALRDAVVKNTRDYAENGTAVDMEAAIVPYTDVRDALISYLSDLYFSAKEKDTLMQKDFEESVQLKLLELKDITLKNSEYLKMENAVEMDHKNLSSQPLSHQLATYITHQVFRGNLVFTERDLELWILKEIRVATDEAFIKRVFAAVDVMGDHIIRPDGVHLFITQLTLRKPRKNSCLRDAILAIFDMKNELAWLMSVLFFAAYLLKSLKGIWYLAFSEKLKFGVVAPWLKILGTLEYVIISVGDICNEYDELARAKAVLSHFLYELEVDTGYEKHSALMKTFQEEGNLNKVSLRQLFDESSIHLPGHVFDHIYHEIDVNHDGSISKQELEDYVRLPANRPIDISILCLKSGHFWSSSFLILGSLFFLGDVYVINELSASITNKIGSILHLAGGLAILYSAYEHQSEFVAYAKHIFEVMASTGLSVVQACRKTVEERETAAKMNATSHSDQAYTC